jgi:general secretion pathway protein G
MELVLVFGLLLVLIGLVLPENKERTRMRLSTAKMDIAAYVEVIGNYARDNSSKYPESLKALVNGKKRYLQQVSKDPWGNDYVYKNNGVTFAVISAGPDGKLGNVDDVVSGNGKDFECGSRR